MKRSLQKAYTFANSFSSLFLRLFAPIAVLLDNQVAPGSALWIWDVLQNVRHVAIQNLTYSVKVL